MIHTHVEGLIQQALAVELIEPLDEIYVRNRVYALLQLDLEQTTTTSTRETIPNLVELIVEDAIQREIIENVFDDKEILSAELMNCFVARPSVINQQFQEKMKICPEKATSYFYALSKNSNYIQMNRIHKNSHFKADTTYGELDITINMSKPEKDPEQIKREKTMKKDHNYPPCVLCVENEGYEGRTGYPARANHRIVQIPLEGENWHLQYSPYVYYNEHSILLSETHRDMKIDKNTFKRLVSFVNQFPHYFIGSNADLPIVGGSILSHDHYQAGQYTFAMTNAKSLFHFTLPDFPGVYAQALDWPLSTIRLQSEDQASLVKATNYVFTKWQTYEDVDAQIIPYTNDTPHHTVTPIARKNGELFELDLVLRNNRTSDEHPLGIFHPHADVHHIKKENIGLIEVMGLAVLPARLKDELVEIEQLLLGKDQSIAPYHEQWAEELQEKYGIVENQKEATTIIQREVGEKFARVLSDAGVFKTEGNWQGFLANLHVEMSG